MRKLLLLILGVFGLCGAAHAVTMNFTCSNGGGTGTCEIIRQTENRIIFELTGSDGGTGQRILTSFTSVNDTGQDIVWSGVYVYETQDQDGPFWDPIGFVFANSVFGNLTPPDGGDFQTGEFSVLVEPGRTFGLGILSRTDDGGAASALVTVRIAPIPLPSALPAMISALGALAFWRRRLPPGAP